MDINILRSIATVACLAIFIGVLWFAYRPSNAERFREASMLPFALDEDQAADAVNNHEEGQPR